MDTMSRDSSAAIQALGNEQVLSEILLYLDKPSIHSLARVQRTTLENVAALAFRSILWSDASKFSNIHTGRRGRYCTFVKEVLLEEMWFDRNHHKTYLDEGRRQSDRKFDMDYTLRWLSKVRSRFPQMRTLVFFEKEAMTSDTWTVNIDDQSEVAGGTIVLRRVGWEAGIPPPSHYNLPCVMSGWQIEGRLTAELSLLRSRPRDSQGVKFHGCELEGTDLALLPHALESGWRLERMNISTNLHFSDVARLLGRLDERLLEKMSTVNLKDTGNDANSFDIPGIYLLPSSFTHTLITLSLERTCLPFDCLGELHAAIHTAMPALRHLQVLVRRGRPGSTTPIEWMPGTFGSGVYTGQLRRFTVYLRDSTDPEQLYLNTVRDLTCFLHIQGALYVNALRDEAPNRLAEWLRSMTEHQESLETVINPTVARCAANVAYRTRDIRQHLLSFCDYTLLRTMVLLEKDILESVAAVGYRTILWEDVARFNRDTYRHSVYCDAVREVVVTGRPDYLELTGLGARYDANLTADCLRHCKSLFPNLKKISCGWGGPTVSNDRWQLDLNRAVLRFLRKARGYFHQGQELDMRQANLDMPVAPPGFSIDAALSCHFHASSSRHESTSHDLVVPNLDKFLQAATKWKIISLVVSSAIPVGTVAHTIGKLKVKNNMQLEKLAITHGWPTAPWPETPWPGIPMTLADLDSIARLVTVDVTELNLFGYFLEMSDIPDLKESLAPFTRLRKLFVDFGTTDIVAAEVACSYALPRGVFCGSLEGFTTKMPLGGRTVSWNAHRVLSSLVAPDGVLKIDPQYPAPREAELVKPEQFSEWLQGLNPPRQAAAAVADFTALDVQKYSEVRLITFDAESQLQPITWRKAEAVSASTERVICALDDFRKLLELQARQLRDSHQTIQHSVMLRDRNGFESGIDNLKIALEKLLSPDAEMMLRQDPRVTGIIRRLDDIRDIRGQTTNDIARMPARVKERKRRVLHREACQNNIDCGCYYGEDENGDLYVPELPERNGRYYKDWMKHEPVFEDDIRPPDTTGSNRCGYSRYKGNMF